VRHVSATAHFISTPRARPLEPLDAERARSHAQNAHSAPVPRFMGSSLLRLPLVVDHETASASFSFELRFFLPACIALNLLAASTAFIAVFILR
jgi:hypothetical protein